MRYLSILFLSILLIGCAHKEESKIRLAAVEWIGYAPLFIADAKGWLPANVKLVEFPSNYDILEAIKSIDLEAAALTLDEVIRIRANHPQKDFVVIAAIDYSNGADAIVATPSIHSIQELKGKRVAYEPKSIQEFMLKRALLLHKLSIEDITPVLIKYDTILKARQQKLFDAAVTFEPIKSKLLATGLHTIFDSSQIPYEIIDVLSVKRTLLMSHPNTLKKLLQAYFKGVRYLQNNPKAQEFLAHMFGVSLAQVRQMLQGVQILGCKENLDYFSTQAPLATKNIASYLIQSGIIKKFNDHLHDPRSIKEICR